MFRSRPLTSLALVLSALALGLLLIHSTSAQEEASAGSRTLYPGDNYIGWVDFATTPQALFDQIPEAKLIYTWDPEDSFYRFAAPGFPATLKSLEPGMGLVVRIGGDQPVEWRQPIAANGEWITLKPGPNLVAWTGPSGTPIDLAVRSIGESFIQARFWIPETDRFAEFPSDRGSTNNVTPNLRRGDALWVFAESESSWLQPSGDRALYPLEPPPDHVRWYASFDKYLDADGLAFVATDNVADEALFRAAAILDEMLANRPDIRETLIRRRVHTVVVGRQEQTFDLAPYRQYRHLIQLEPHGPGGPRGLGPNQFTPTLVPEEDLLCYGGTERGYDITIHEFAHAIDYALSRGTVTGNFSSSLTRAYRSGIDSGLWDGTYGSTNTAEFWAEAVGAWVGTGQAFDMPFKNRLHLIDHSPPIAELVTSTLGDFQVDATCHVAQSPVKGATLMHIVRGQISDHLGEPLERAEVWLLGADRFSPTRLSSTWADGGYAVFAPPREYSLALLVDGCRVRRAKSFQTPGAWFDEQLSPIGQDVQLDIQLEAPYCTIAAFGALLDANGRDVDSYHLIAEGDAGKARRYLENEEGFSVRFPDDGEYSLRFRYRRCEYFYDGDGLIRGPRFDLRFSADQIAEADLELRLPQGACSGTLAGRLLDESGRPDRDTVVGLHIPLGQSSLSPDSAGSFRVWVDLPSKPILEILAQGCRAYFGVNGLKLDVDEVIPFELTSRGLDDLEITIPDELCDPVQMLDS